MSAFARVLTVALGVVAIIWGNLPGGTFYPGGLGIVNRVKPIPMWLGRLWFSLIGLWFIYAGLVGPLAMLLQKVIAVGLGVAIILSGFAAQKQAQPIRPRVLVGTLTDREPLGGLLFLVVGLGFIVGGLLLK